MKYEKPVMKKAELIRMGFSREWLDKAVADKNQNFAWRSDVSKPGSGVLFDTAQLEAYRLNEIKLTKAAVL